MLRVTINDQAYEFDEDVTILHALRTVGADAPTLCHDERLKPYGGCRLCIVQVHGHARPVTACDTCLADGMVINTHTPEIETLRRTLLKLIAHRYPADPLRQSPDKEFHRLIRTYGLEGELRGAADTALIDDSHPYIHVDMSQCIDCYRCIRICEEVQGQFVWQAWNRGDATRIRPDSRATFRESSCVGCGACVDTCPTGALEDKSLLTPDKPAAWTRTTCPYCGTGCEMEVGTRNERIIAVKPVLDAPVSKGHLCVKGRYAYDFVHADDRITTPMIRDNGAWKNASWQEAIAYTAERLQTIATRHDPDSIGILGSARATNEENYLAQKFARMALGTNNVDCCARVCHTPTAAAMKLMLGTGASTNSFDDIEQAHTILICGANPTENHPVVGARIKQAALRGVPLIVIDPRRIELADYAALHMALRPGTNVPLLNAMACAIVEEQLHDEVFLRERISGWPQFEEFIKQWTPEHTAVLCGVDANLIRQAARLYATNKPAMSFHGLGITEHTQGTEGVMCLVNLALLTGNIGKRGAGINPLRGQNNVQGAAHMGCDPGTLTGGISIKDGQSLFEKIWGAPLPVAAGLNLLQMMDAAAQGKLKALWAIGYDVLLTNADAHTTRQAMKSMELVIIQDMFLTETAKSFGSVFLPAASSFEKDGTFMNAERRIQRIRKAIPPPGQAKPDWEIICDIARAMGKGEFFEFQSAEDIWNEVRAVWAAGNGISYRRLEHGGLQWPCPTENHPGTQIMHTESFALDKQAALRRIDYRPTAEKVNEDFPFLLVTGRTLYQFNAGTMTLRTKNIVLRPCDVLDISPADAERLGLKNGERVKITSRYGDAELPINITPAVKKGELFATFHTPQVFLNNVTSAYRDRHVKTPEYKITAVRIEKTHEEKKPC